MPEKHDLVQAVLFQGRMMSARILLFHQSIGARFGLHPTDYKCLDLAQEESEITAGRLAHLTGLTTGAITAALDRLEKSGFVRRQRDPKDRRVVRVQVLRSGVKKLGRAFDQLKQRMTEVNEGFTAAELEAVYRYQAKVIETLTSMMHPPRHSRKSAKPGNQAN